MKHSMFLLVLLAAMLTGCTGQWMMSSDYHSYNWTSNPYYDICGECHNGYDCDGIWYNPRYDLDRCGNCHGGYLMSSGEMSK